MQVLEAVIFGVSRQFRVFIHLGNETLLSDRDEICVTALEFIIKPQAVEQRSSVNNVSAFKWQIGAV